MYFFVFSLFSKVPAVTACYFYTENTKASFETESTVNTKPVTSHKKGSDPRGLFFPLPLRRGSLSGGPKNMPLVTVAWLYLDNNGVKCRVAGHCCHSHVPSICFSMTWKILKYWFFFEKEGPQVL